MDHFLRNCFCTMQKIHRDDQGTQADLLQSETINMNYIYYSHYYISDWHFITRLFLLFKYMYIF